YETASFASMFKDNTSKKTVHLSELRNDEYVSGADVSISWASVNETLIEVSSTSALLDSLIDIPFQNGLGLEKSNNIESTINDSDIEEVKNVFVEDNGKPMDGLVDDARKNEEAPPKKTPRKTGIWSGRKSGLS
ncbi:hypothetical protein Tco_0915573, partial [Tanacetum coccineum]